MGGWAKPAFREVVDVLEEAAGARGGAAVCVYHRGEPVVDAWAGCLDGHGTPWAADTVALAFSTVKGVTATALHQCVDRGLLDYDDPVARHWPEFARAGKAGVTVRHLLCHEAGLHALRSWVARPETIADWTVMTRGLAAQRPGFAPGSANAYHAVTFGFLVGEVVRRATGRDLGTVVRDEIAGPLGLDGCWIGCPPAERHRLATLIAPPADADDGTAPHDALRRAANAMGFAVDAAARRDALGPPGLLDFLRSAAALDCAIPAANGVFTARALARFYAALAAGGALDGVALLSPATLARATAVQNRRPDIVLAFPMFWRLGFHGVLTDEGPLPTAFGHAGFGGSGAWADPERDLAVALVVNRLAGSTVGDERLRAIGGAAVRGAGARPTPRRARRSA